MQSQKCLASKSHELNVFTVWSSLTLLPIIWYVFFIKCGSSPDEDTLAVVSLPQAAVALVGHGKDVRGQLPHLVFAVQIDCSAVIQARYLLVGVYCCQDRTDVGLREKKKQTESTREKEEMTEEDKKKRKEDRLSVKGDRIRMV